MKKSHIGGKIVNPVTNRYVNKNGRIGKALTSYNVGRVQKGSGTISKFINAITVGDLQLVTELVGTEFKNACDIAITHGQFEVLKFLHAYLNNVNEVVYPLDLRSSMWVNLYFTNNLEILKYLGENNCIFSNQLVPCAMELLNEERSGIRTVPQLIGILTYLFAKKCPYDKEKLFTDAIEVNDVELMKFLIKIKAIEYCDVSNLFKNHSKRFEVVIQMGYTSKLKTKTEEVVEYLRSIENKTNFTKRINNPNKVVNCTYGDKDLCSICDEGLSKKGHGQLNCGHCFHNDCLFTWTESKQQNRLKCPTCRSKIETKTDTSESTITLSGGGKKRPNLNRIINLMIKQTKKLKNTQSNSKIKLKEF